MEEQNPAVLLGSIKTDKKAKSSRENGKKGGRPKKVIELRDIDRGSKIMCFCSDGSNYIIFNNLDGMYSHCTSEKGNTFHLSLFTPLILVSKGVYQVDWTKND